MNIQNLATYVYLTFKEHLDGVSDKDDILWMDAGYIEMLTATMRRGQPIELMTITDYTDAFTSDNLDQFHQKIEDLLLLSMDEFPDYHYTEHDILGMLGLPHDDNTLRQTFVTKANCCEVLRRVVADNAANLEARMAAAKKYTSEHLAYLLDACAQKPQKRIVYIGCYPQIFNLAPLPEGLTLELRPFTNADKRLFQLALIDLKIGVANYFDAENGYPLEFSTDYLWSENADRLSHQIVNTISGLHAQELRGDGEITKDGLDAEILYKELLPFFENTEYNFTDLSLKNTMLNVHEVAETEEATDAADAEFIRYLREANMQVRIPTDLLASYDKLPEGRKPGNGRLAVGVSSYGIAGGVLTQRISELLADEDVDTVIVALDDSRANAVKDITDSALVIVPLPNGYAATVNLLATTAAEYAEYIMLHDCNDPVSPEFFKRAKAAAAKKPAADVITFQCTCVGGLYVTNALLDPTIEIYSTLYARRYINLAAMIFKADVFQTVALDPAAPCNSQYEFLYRLVLAGAEFDADTSPDLFHRYELSSGKHMADKLEYAKYLDYINVKHQAVINTLNQRIEKHKADIAGIAEMQARPDAIQTLPPGEPGQPLEFEFVQEGDQIVIRQKEKEKE